MSDRAFVYQNFNAHRVRIILTAIVLVVFLGGAYWAISASYGEAIEATSHYLTVKNVINNEVKELTPAGIFYIAFAGGLFFLPIPIEMFFFTGLTKGNPPWLSFFLVLSALLVAHPIDYLIGKRLSPFFMNLISKERIYKIRRKVNKYGSYTIFIFNVLPLPSPVLSFALGIAKYNFTRLYAITIVGTVVKYAVIIFLYQYFGSPLQNFLLG